MIFDNAFVVIVLIVLFFGLLSLVIGKFFIHQRNYLQAANTLWYVTLGLLVCLGFIVCFQNWLANDQKRKLQEQIDDLQDKQIKDLQYQIDDLGEKLIKLQIKVDERSTSKKSQ
jgi:hypothetical protein